MKPTRLTLQLLLTLAAALVIIALVTDHASAGDTLTVDDDGGEQYTRIQHAIENATDGDTIEVREGTYYENVVVDRSVDLVGAGADKTTIDGGGEDDVVRIEADWVNVSGFRVVNGGDSGIGIEIVSNYCTIRDNQCTDDYYGIQCNGRGIKILDNLCNDNRYYGIAVGETSNSTIIGNICNNNSYFANILVSDSRDVVVENNICTNSTLRGIRIVRSENIIVSNNICSGNQDGISIYQSKCYVNHNILFNSEADINILSSANSSFINNTCIDSMIGFRLSRSNNNTFVENTITNNTIGIYVYSSKDNSAHYNLIYDNLEHGINATENDGYTIDATNNFWGHISGPHHLVSNPDGKGDNITDFVEFDLWLDIPDDYDFAVPLIESMEPNPALVSEEIHFAGTAETDITIERYSWRSSLDNELYNGTDPEFQRDDLTMGEHTIYLKVLDSRGIWCPEIETSLVVHTKPTATILPISPSPAAENTAVAFTGDGTDDGTVTHYAWRSSLDSEFYNGTDAAFEYSGLSVGTHTIFLKVMDNNGVWSDEDSTDLVISGPRTGVIGVNNQTLVQSSTDLQIEKAGVPTITEGDAASFNGIVTGDTDSVFIKIMNTFQYQLEHVDSSGGQHNGTTFYRNVTVPFEHCLLIHKNSEIEFGVEGSFDYDSRGTIDGQPGNPIQDSLDYIYTVKEGRCHFMIWTDYGVRGEDVRGSDAGDTKGTRAGANPTVDVLSQFPGSDDVGRIRVTVPIMDLTEAQSFSIGISEYREAEVEVFEGALDVNLKSPEPDPNLFDSFFVEPATDGAPQGVIIEKIEADLDVDVEKADVYVVRVTGDVNITSNAATPSIQVGTNEHIIFLDPEELEDLMIDAASTYSIEIIKYTSDESEPVQTVTISDIWAGGMDTIYVRDDSISFHTDSANGKIITITVRDDNNTFEVELMAYEGETYELEDVDMDSGTATLTWIGKDGCKYTIEIETGTTAEELDSIFHPPPPDDDDDDDSPGFGAALLLLSFVVGVTWLNWKMKEE